MWEDKKRLPPPHPNPLPFRARGYKKNIPSKGEEIIRGGKNFFIFF
jgi:hypothetical protein